MIPWLVNIPVHIGEILASRYRVEGVLGEGAMGVVVAARHVQLGSLFALKFMRAAAALEDGSEKHIAMENRLYPMRELLGDLLLAQQQPAQALAEYETALKSTPNRLRGLYGAATAADLAKNPQKATAHFQALVKLTREADTDRMEIRAAKAFLARK